MVAHPGAPLGAHGLRTLGLPRPIEVTVDEHGQPAHVWTSVVGQGTKGLAVAQVEERWRISEEWWREAALERTYYRLILEDGRPLDIFLDDRTGEWFEQRYQRQHGTAR